MRSRLSALYVLAALCCLFSCSGGNRTAGKDNVNEVRHFPSVGAPGIYTDPAERMDYVAEHFWDAFMDTSSTGRCDSLYVKGVPKEELETKFGLFSTALWQIDISSAAAAVTKLFRLSEMAELSDTSSNVFETIASYALKYFYDPNSPVRNEEFYLPYVRGLAESPAVPDNMKPAYSYDASMCSLNRVGSQAADFAFKDLSGKVHTLRGVNADFTLLFFSNPGCPSCKEITEALESDPGIHNLLEEGRLAVVNIYIDLELDKWRSYAAGYPAEWLSGYDYKYIIRTDQIYNVRAIPSLYLLDKEKKVLLKDAPQDKVFALLSSLAG